MKTFAVFAVALVTFGLVDGSWIEKRTFREKDCSEEDAPECEVWESFGWCVAQGYSNACPQICLRCCDFPAFLQSETTEGVRYSGYRSSVTNVTATYRCFNGWKYGDLEVGGAASCYNRSQVLLPPCVQSECFFVQRLALQERVELLGDDTAVYRCNEDYLVEGSDSREGLAVCNNGTVDYPVCVAALCTLPAWVEHGYMTHMFYNNNTAVYHCYSGYMYDTSVTTGGVGQCDEDGNAVLPACVYTGCAYPYYISNGYKTAYDSRGGRAQYTCEPGYAAEDGGVAECVEGVLTGIPECLETIEPDYFY